MPLPDMVNAFAPVIWSTIVVVLFTARLDAPVVANVVGVPSAVPSISRLPLFGLPKIVVALGLENVTLPLTDTAFARFVA